MKKQKLVSIVLPSYNGEKYLRKSINSILAQTYDNWELILVDDYSEDNTWQIMQEYKNRNTGKIYSVRNRKNLRLPASLNLGFSKSKGDYLSWTSDDNLYRPNAIEEMVSFLESRPEVDFVYSDYSLIDENGQEIQNITVPTIDELLYRNVIGSCFLYKRFVMEEVGLYSKEMFLAEDYDYWFRINKDFSMSPLHKNLYQYRWHSQSLTIKHQSDAALADYKVRWINLHLLDSLPKSKKSDAYLSLAEQGKKLGCRKKVIQCLYLSFINNFFVVISPAFLKLIIFSVFGMKIFLLIRTFDKKLFHN